ncbi:MAG: M28 family peptidase [Thermoanaerobaculia bacterium]
MLLLTSAAGAMPAAEVRAEVRPKVRTEVDRAKANRVQKKAEAPQIPAAEPPVDLREPREAHLSGIRQLTFGGENAEAYWAQDGTKLSFQTTRPPYKCDQIFSLPLDGSEPTLLSTGRGKTTCSYFYPDGKRFLYASTHLGSPDCPAPPDRSHGYTWAIDGAFEIFSRDTAGGELTQMTHNDSYDAEATICPLDGSIVFTSARDGDLDLYRMDADGGNVVRLTNTPGYDGGAFFSRDCKQIVYRASRPTGAELEDYRKLLAQHLVRPGKLEIWAATMTPEGARDAHQVTDLDAASFAPYFFPDGKRIIFSSNYGDPKGREFDLWAINVDGSRLERITYAPGFDGFPIFSPDGTMLAFSSNRHQKEPGETDVYVAQWVDGKIVAPEMSEARPEDRYAADVAWLADDARDGRGVGTPGIDEATAYIEDRFRSLGLEPAGDAGTFRQEFDVTVALTSGAKSALAIDGKPLAADTFAPMSFSKSGAVDAKVVFAGYGIVAPDKRRDDYAHIDAKGKIVLVRRFVPPGEAFSGTDERRYSDLRYKAFTAREHGAKALLVVDLPEVAPRSTAGASGNPATPPSIPDEAPLPKLSAEDAGDAGLLVVAVKREAGEKLITGKHKATVTVELVAEHRKASNVVARMKSGNPAAHPGAVVLGAHYDHLGHGGTSSLAPGSEEIHNGADDNASGTAALLEAARLLGERRKDLGEDVLFIAFSGEERGLLGSTAFTRTPPAGLDLKSVRAMVNMDMVGRLRENKLAILGGGSAEEWPGIAEPLCAARGLTCATSGDGYGPSDQTPFYAAGIPVLHLFTGTHDDYHRPSDDSDKINATGGATVAALAADLVVAATTAEKLTLRSVPDPAPRGDVRSFGASLGTIPDYTGPVEGQTGVLLAGVRPGGPAEKAGIQRGDRLIGLLGREIGDINDFMFLLRQAKPGDKAKAIVMRDGKRLELEVVFGESRRM